MSKVDELVKRYCPDGVVYKSLSECTHKVNNIKWKEDNNTYQYVDLTSVDRETHSIIDSTTINEGNAPSRAQQIIIEGDVLFGGTRPMLKRYCMVPKKYDGQICSTGFCVLRPQKEVVLSSWLYHIITTSDFYAHVEKYQKGASDPAITDKEIKMYKIPVPPLEVQEAIVSILNKYTCIESELVSKLSDELQARIMQIEYYRDALIASSDGKPGKLIDMLEQPVTDGPHTTPQLFESGVPFISATAVYDGRVHLEDMKGYISKEFDDECAKKYKPQMHDVFMVKSGSTTGKVAYVDFEDDFNVWSPIAAMRANSSCSSRYLFHLLQTTDIQNQVKGRMSHGSQPNLSMRVIEQFDVVIPSLEEQERIANLLDRIDELSIGFKSTIPEEIAARQKQYEYYRDKLLTFKEAV